MSRSVADIARHWLSDRVGQVGDVERRVLQSAIDRKAIARDTNVHADDRTTRGERLADRIATIGGSWSFILGFLAFLALWALANVWLLGQERFDPYPFVFLNLVLSMIAALQAPVIMMSQNRQAARDRLDATHDYEVNLKAEIEIMALHEKLDELRQRELIALRQQIEDMAAHLHRIEARLPGGAGA